MDARGPIRIAAAGLTLGVGIPAAAEICPARHDDAPMPGLFLRIPLQGDGQGPERRGGIGVEVSYNCIPQTSDLLFGLLAQAELGFGGGGRFALAGQAGLGLPGIEAGLFVDRVGDETGVGLHTAPFLSAGVVWTALRFSFGTSGVYTDILVGAKLPLGADAWGGSPFVGGGGETVAGRPLRDGTAPVWPGLWREGSWGWQPVDLEALEPPARAWARQALEERASVDAFLKIAVELQGLGAPRRLLRAVVQAAREEWGHARRCLAHAAALAGPGGRLQITPVAWPASEPAADALRARLIREALHDGLVGEVCAAAEAQAGLRALRQGDRAAPAGVRETLRQIVREESQHAVLGARILRFCLATGGAAARDALADAARTLRPISAPRGEHSPSEAAWLGRVGQRPRSWTVDPTPAWRFAQGLLRAA